MVKQVADHWGGLDVLVSWQLIAAAVQRRRCCAYVYEGQSPQGSAHRCSLSCWYPTAAL